MAKKVFKITTKIQNIFLGVAVALFCLGVAIKAIQDFSSNTAKITNKEISELNRRTSEVEQSVNRYVNSIFESMGEIYYDERIKKAAVTSNTKLFPLYREKTRAALREFALFKDLKNIFLFNSDYNLVSSVNRSIYLNADNVSDISKRLEEFKDKQLVMQTIANKKVVLFIYRLDYSEFNHAYVVVVDDLSNLTNGLADYQTKEAEYYLFSRTLGYKNSLIKLKQADSINYYNLQENTLMRFNSEFIRSYNSEGVETISKVEPLNNFQYSFVLGILKPDFLVEKIASSKSQISSYYTFWLVWAVIFALIYILLVISKLNIHRQLVLAKGKIIELFKSKDDKIKPQELSKAAKRQAYSYIEEENALKNSVFKVYNSLRKMSPEDIRNLSIKNSLSKENIRLVYQPVVDSKTMQPQFCEVFLRLLNYYGEELMPSEFIPVLSHFNMLENLDEMMLEKVIKKVQSLQSTDETAKISLNISNGAFNSSKFLRKLKAGLIQGNINTENVMLELPSLTIIENENHSAFIKDLRSYGVHFAVSVDLLDNTTLKQITDHNIQYVRINMSAFSNVLENIESQKTLKQIISNAKKYNLQIVAERIETEFMFKLAKSLEIPLLQGYYIGKPKKYYTHK